MSADLRDYTKWDKAVLIPIKELVYTDWNCNEMDDSKLAELTAEVENPDDPNDPHFDEPLQVVPIKGKAKRWLVLGGHHRSKVMTGLNQDAIPCVIRWDLAGKSRKELMAWTVRRNNLRGKHNAQKYAELEGELVSDGTMTREAARRSMLMEDELAAALVGAASTTSGDDDAPSSTSTDKPPTDGGSYESSDDRDAAAAQQQRAELLNALKIAEQDVLLDSADTVEHGYLFFVQGSKGQSHLVVNESNKLHGLVGKMVAACKGNSAKVDDFLSAAIHQELQNWE